MGERLGFPPVVTLRPYQEECLAALRRAYGEGRRRVLVSLPTGTGKTVVFARFPAYFQMKRRLLVLAHRRELLDQAREKFLAADPGLAVEIEQADRRAGAEAQVVLASVPTLGRAGSRRLAALAPEDFYLIVVDEAHHAVAATYRRVFDHFGLFEESTDRMLIGFTATPYRGDRRGLGEVFEDIAYARALPEMIAEGFLARIRGWRVTTGVELDGVRVRHGDFVESQLARVVDVEERNRAVVQAYGDLAAGRRCLVFCVDVEHARSVAAAFQAAGVRAAAVWGAMPQEDRARTLERFGSGELDVVTNCNVLTEGFDEPRVDCVIMARPTRSRLLYVQMVGRGTRLHGDKRDLVVIDVADATRVHSLANLPGLFDLPPGFDLTGGDVLQSSQDLRRLAQSAPWVDLTRVDRPELIPIAAERVDLFNTEPPDEIRGRTRLAWHSGPSGDYRLVLPDRESLVVRENLLGSWDLVLQDARGETRVDRRSTAAEAIRRGDRFVARARPDARRVLDLRARWRDEPPTEKQLAELQRRAVPVPPGLTRGQASWILSMARTHGSGRR